MHDQHDFKARIDEVLEEFVAVEIAGLLAIDDGLAPVATQLRAALAGGKRLRAAFCYWGWRAAGQPDTEAVIKAAAALELVHAAATVHDDIIDDSVTRRGVPTAHLALRAALRTGEDRRARAVALAILVGDLLMTWAGQLFTSCGLPGAFVVRARPLWTVLARELIAGECLEILCTGDRPRVERSLQIIRFKTAKYTIERPLHLGGALAGAPKNVMSAFTAYGVPLGEAFQLRDDLLGMFGDPELTGKSNLDDLRGHKPTALLAVTLSAVEGTERGELERLLGRPDPEDPELRLIKEIIERTGARKQVESMIEERTAEALHAIGDAGLPVGVANALTQLAHAVVTRET